MDRIERLDQLPRNVPLFFFGAGGGGQLLKKAASRFRNVRLMGFIDNAKGGSKIGDTPVMDLASFLRIRSADARIVISSQYVEAIAEQLQDAGVSNFLDASPLVEHLVEQRIRAAEARRLLLLCLAILPAMIAMGWALLPIP
jgi:FlaA1/EpsC-like NDP-sugar epimerase